MISGDYIYLDAGTLQAMLTQALTARSGILGAAQSYSIAGRQMTKAALDSVNRDIKEISFALQFVTGTLPSREAVSDMSHGPD